MELRKKYILRDGESDTIATIVRDSSGRVRVECADGSSIEDAIVLDEGRTVSIRHQGRMYLVDVTPRNAKRLRALVNGRGGLVELLDELAAAAADTTESGASSRELRAEMPGMVVDVKCKVGDEVERGQPLVVLEAMKMQNELPSPADGVVEAIHTEAGRSVETGTVLVQLAAPSDEPPAS